MTAATVREDKAMKRWVSVFVVFALMGGAGYAQTVGASVQGTISDATGAVLTRAKIGRAHV